MLSLRVDGREVPAGMQVVEATVVRDIGALPEARVVLRASLDDPLPPGRDDAFPPGAAIEIDVLREGSTVSLFRGVLTGKSISIEGGDARRLVMTCRHPLYVATLAPKFGLWRDIGDADCIAQVLAVHGHAVQGKPSGEVHALLSQRGISDWSFAQARAEANGWWLLATDEGVALRVPDGAQAAAFVLEAGISIDSFEGQWDVGDQPAGVQAMAWAPSGQDVLAVSAEEPSAFPGRMPGSMLAAVHAQALELRYAGDMGEQSLHALASSTLQARRRASPRGRVGCSGTQLAVPGAWMELRGVGQGFDGDVPVSGVTHRVGDTGWTMEVRFGTHADTNAAAEPAGRRDTMDSLQIGIVEALDDPRGEDRVRVRLPLLGDDVGVHARLARPDAGTDRGLVFFPEIGDEVLVACLDGDPRHAVVLGSLHSSARPSPLTPRNDTPVKGYVSRRGIKLLFEDGADALRLETPAGRTVVLSDDDAAVRIEDPHGNRIVMDANGIAIHSARDLSLTAGDDVRLQAVGVHLDATSQLDLSGAAGAKLQSPGALILRGSIVQIN